MTGKTLAVLAFSTVVAALAGGCVEESTTTTRTPVVNTAGGSNEARDQAMAGVLERIANATCDREQSCHTIGPGAYFASRDVCMSTIREKYGKELNMSMCPSGIESTALDDCIKSLQAGECTEPGDEIRRTATCPSKQICMK